MMSLATKEFHMSHHSVALQVISLFAEYDSELCIKQGRVWATLGTGGDDVDNNYGDHFLEAGQKLSVLKGQHLVFESMNLGVPVFFDFLTAAAVYDSTINNTRKINVLQRA
jgi:Protein of unknown function (DUF2917)